ncbi:hypothetical protein GMDG_00152 [Pseudogymnoascus destructans 20631-21]|uniref:Zinc finger PHD-type domain-containing protein n=1 Tax=Pseudogymnoascus destructans (strain ATCC MYA-4855 / 20631-21) TaxID=658429 RepID=L8FWN8_PSED2|nr:hypothetical protein GMDG_00152 [Pseudogymnoascus destructans 20631-21]
MAGTSPRRSIRSRPLTQQNSNSHHSSASSNSSSRGERNTRTSAKAESPRKLTSNESLSSEPLDDRVASSIEESLSTRRRKRGQTDEQDKELKDKRPDMPNGISEPVGEDDEAVRCICGSDDYPGPPQISDEDKKGIKEVVEPDLITPEDYTEDLAGFFLQCDMCKVWQHGGCVGIKNEDMSPDEYFCELCRSDLHKVFTASNGQKYSHYLPLYQHQHQHHQTTLSRSTSRASRAASFSKDGTRSPRAGSKNGRPTSSSMMSANQKRRSTMNSRDAAYDEEEQLRRAIEASKGEKSESTDGGGGGTSRKRGRSDSEEKQDFPKRQRTLSNSPSPQKEALTPFGPSNDSDDAETTRPVGAKKIRGAAARNHREKEAREEREKTRLEAANKRKGRAERRRVDDLEPPEDLLPSTPTPTAPSTTVPQPTTTDTPPAPPASIPPSSPPPPKTTPSTTTTNTTTNTITTAAATTSTTTSHKKGGRPAHTRKGKVGKNQYTRDRDADDSHNTTNASPRRSESREGGVGGAGGRGGGEEGRRGGGAGGGGRGKTSILDMRRRVAGMLEFISRTQVEMAEMGDTGEAERVVRALGGVVGVDFGSAGHNAGGGGGEEGGYEDR